MTCYILYDPPSSKEIINCLKKHYSSQIKSINNIIGKNKGKNFAYILIENDIIKETFTYNFNLFPTIIDDVFILNIDILMKCDKNTFIIKNIDINEFLNVNNTCDYPDYLHLIKVNDGYYYISDVGIKIFFNNIKTIEYNNYIRNIKLQKLL